MAGDGGPWQCAACTLINEASRRRCAACEGPPPWACKDENSSGVVVVLSPGSAEAAAAAQPGSAAASSPRRQPKRPRAEAAEEEHWACSACTLVNSPGAQQCAACGGRRWVLPSSLAARSVPAASAALRAARRGAAAVPAIETREVPVGEWAALPPAPEDGPAQASAHDRDLDIFSEAAGPPAAPDAVGPLGAAAAEGAGETESRPAWGTGGQPLFAGFSTALGGADAPALEGGSPFDDAVGRLTVLGFDPTKCHLALQAANGNEELARDFLVQNA